MKKRSGFVSNSSSASFIVKFHTNKSREELGELIKKSDGWLETRWDATKMERYRFDSLFSPERETEWIDIEPESKKMLIGESSEFEFKPETAMFNDWTDVPGWVFIRAIDEGRIPDIYLDKIIQTESEYDSVNDEVEFVRHTWEYEDYMNRPDAYNEKDAREALGTQDDREFEYLSYLSKIGTRLTEEETIFLAKHKLSEKWIKIIT